MDAGERQTEQQLRQAHKQPLFHLKTFLSKAGAGRTIVYLPGKQTLFEQGKRGNAVFYILTGAVKLTVVSQGKEITIGLLGPGNFAGKECIATGRPRRRASAKALTNCTILKIERKEMLRVIQHEKTFAAFFLDYLLARISRYQEVIMYQLLDSSEKRLARALLAKMQKTFHSVPGNNRVPLSLISTFAVPLLIVLTSCELPIPGVGKQTSVARARCAQSARPATDAVF
jgi:CRP-like cAMP-binding protein